MRRSGVSVWRRLATKRLLICNAAERRPGLPHRPDPPGEDPHSVLEGMGIGAYATGASLGWVYVHAEYGSAMSRLRTALKQAEHRGFLGNPIGGSKARVHIEVREGTGKLACGDETFLINAIEGKQTMPFVCSSRPPLSGLGDKPTLVHSVETWAHVSAILEKGAAWYAGFGTGLSRGTRVFTLSGNVVNPGLIEVPLGTPLREIVHDIGAVSQTARRSRRCRSAVPQGVISLPVPLDLPVDDEHLFDAGTFMGSGTILVMDGDACMVDRARCALSFLEAESCGKCVFCREGTMQMAEILTDVTEGRGKPHDIDLPAGAG